MPTLTVMPPLSIARTATLDITNGIRVAAAVELPRGFLPNPASPPMWLAQGTVIGVVGTLNQKAVVVGFGGKRFTDIWVRDDDHHAEQEREVSGHRRRQAPDARGAPAITIAPLPSSVAADSVEAPVISRPLAQHDVQAFSPRDVVSRWDLIARVEANGAVSDHTAQSDNRIVR